MGHHEIFSKWFQMVPTRNLIRLHTESAKSDFYITPLEKNINFLLKQAEGKKQHF
jgi:hypothetical protein